MNDVLTIEGPISITLAALTTLAVIAAIGITFLLRPGRTTILWAFAFTLAMAATFASAAGEATGEETLRRIGVGALMGAPAYLLSGFQSYWGRRDFAWTGPVIAAASAVILVLVPDDAYALAYRCVFLVASLFAGAFFVAWIRQRARRRDPVLIPLASISVTFLVLGVVVFVSGLVMPADSASDLALTRLVSSIGMLAYVICAAIAVVGISLRHADRARRAASPGDWTAFQTTARERLLAASRVSGLASLIYVQLDDLTDIRQAADPRTVTLLTTQLMQEARGVMSADAILGSPRPGVAVALVPGSDVSVRESLKTLLERITLIDVGGRLPIQPSASIGWAPTSILGFEFDALAYMSREAAIVAGHAGGDRWERVGATVTDRILNPSTRR